MTRLLFILTCFMAFCVSRVPVDGATPQTHLVIWGRQNFDSRDFDQPFTQVAAGGAHIVALKNDGTVVAWGSNGFGQSKVPAGLRGAKAIAAGWN